MFKIIKITHYFNGDRMIMVLEKSKLDDSNIKKGLINNISINDKIIFSKENIYYFGNYDERYIKDIRRKLYNNKRNIINAVEKGIKFIICGNSVEIFNNNFNAKDFYLYTSYNKNQFKNKINGIKFKKRYKKNRIINIDNLNSTINSTNFRYKNLICIKNINDIIKL